MQANAKPQTFIGVTSGEAFRKVREAFGDDAIILSNKPKDGMTEVIAMSQSAIGKLADDAEPATSDHKAPTAISPAPNQPLAQEINEEAASLLSELRSMRAVMQSQISAQTSQPAMDPGRKAVAKVMLNAGFSALLARSLSGYTPPGTHPDQALQWLRTGLTKHLPIAGRDMVEEGGIFALVGPTGVGKTTTTAKIAAHCAMRYGPKSFTLITTDTYRLAAEAQLQGFGKILGSPVHTVSSAEDLQDTIEDLKNKHLILIDTVGMSQRDHRVSEQIGMLMKAGKVKRVLVMNCATSGAVLDDIAGVYSDTEHGPLHGAILTKADESLHLGSALDVLIRRKLSLLYVTNGQRVPEDITVPNARDLIERAFAATQSNAFAVSDFELQLGAA
jgi:flagellar biosynthesis protein FlhF